MVLVVLNLKTDLIYVGTKDLCLIVLLLSFLKARSSLLGRGNYDKEKCDRPKWIFSFSTDQLGAITFFIYIKTCYEYDPNRLSVFPFFPLNVDW